MTRETLEKAKSIQNTIDSLNRKLNIIENMTISNQEILSINVVEGLNITHTVSLDRDTIGQDILKLSFDYLLEEEEKLEQELKEL